MGGKILNKGARRPKKRVEIREPIAPDAQSVDDSKRLAQDLAIHQIELEMQNEQLRTTRHDLEVGLSRYTELFDFAPIGYASLDADEVIKEINLVGAELLGAGSLSRRDLTGLHFGQFFSSDQFEIFRDLLRTAAESEAMERSDLVIYRAGRTPIQLSVSVSCPSRSGSATLVAFQDITEHKARERKLIETQEALRNANDRTTAFIATLSHELRNPLTPITSSLYVLDRADPGSESARKARTIIARQVKHMTRLIDDLLDVTRITYGKVQLQREHIELGELIRRTFEDHRSSFERSGVTLEYECDAGFFWVDADAARMVQVFTNILGNAQKFTPRGGRVVVKMRRLDRKVSLSVHDTGIGIASRVMEYLFEPFAQGPQTMARSHGGLGLGLATVKGLVELHGGTVSIWSDGPGQGTLVSVLLPLVEAPAERVGTMPVTSAPHRRVLVIEDNQDAANTLYMGLTLSGHEVEVAYDGRSGLAAALRFRPEVVICDIGLPGMNGYEVARTIRMTNELKDVSLVALTGYTAREDMVCAQEAGFDKHLAKPYALDALDRVIREARRLPVE